MTYPNLKVQRAQGSPGSRPFCRTCQSPPKNLPKKKLSDENPSTKVTLRLGNSLMKPQCKFETSAEGQSRRTNRLFSSLDRVAAVRAAIAATTPDKTPEKPIFIASHSIGLEHCQGNRVAWRQTKMVRNSSLRFDAVTPATTASCFSLSTVLTSRISGSKWRERTCSLFCICAVHSFTLIVVSPRFRLCSFFYLFSHLASLISSYHDVQYDYGAHKAERSSNAASELRTLRQAIQGMTTKLLRFPKLRTVWFSRVVALRLVPVLAGKAPVKAGCSGVGAFSNFSLDTLGYDACASKRSHAIMCVIFSSKLILEVAFLGGFRLSSRLQGFCRGFLLFLFVFTSGVFQTLLYMGTHV